MSSAFLLSPSATILRLSTVEREPVLCAGLDIPCDGNQCCGGYPFINSLTFPCPSAVESFAGCPTTGRYIYQEETLAASEPVKCPGSRDWCSRVQCCPGFAGSNNLTFPCPTASASYNMCQTTTRLTDASACDAITTSAFGDPHVTSVTGEKIEVRVRPDSQGTQSLLCSSFHISVCISSVVYHIFRGVTAVRPQLACVRDV